MNEYPPAESDQQATETDVEPAEEPDASEEDAAPGWYPSDHGGLRFYDGKDWTDHRAAPGSQLDKEDLRWIASQLVWAMSLACGVAGALAWNAPVVAYYWPLGLGGAGIALAIAARSVGEEVPWYAVIAVVASLVAIGLGIDGYSQIEDVRESLENSPF